MFEYKLQLGCLMVVLYILASYLKDTLNSKIKCHILYDWILGLSPWAIILDGVTAWTVNNQDKIPPIVNLILHGMFFIIMDVMIVLVYFYMISVTVGLQNRKKVIAVMLLPGAASVLGIIIFLNKTYYIAGATTCYSMGPSVIFCYMSLLLHFCMVGIVLIAHHRTIEDRKKLGVISFIFISLIVLAVQFIYAESLVSSLLPMMATLALYVNFEDPYYRRLNHYNSEMVMGFATLVENRDNNTGGHIKRTKGYVSIIIDGMKEDIKYHHLLTKDYIEDVVNAAPMHDIGKIATPDVILQKPGKLTDEEYEIMKQHSAKGGAIIKETFADIDDVEYLHIAYEVARYHHEKWNGKGYPDGLAGEEIPIHARIMAIADVFDAVSAKRCYRDAMPLDKCFKIIEEGIGTDFDPTLAKIFLANRDKVEKYYNENK